MIAMSTDSDAGRAALAGALVGAALPPPPGVAAALPPPLGAAADGPLVGAPLAAGAGAAVLGAQAASTVKAASAARHRVQRLDMMAPLNPCAGLRVWPTSRRGRASARVCSRARAG